MGQVESFLQEYGECLRNADKVRYIDGPGVKIVAVNEQVKTLLCDL